MVNTQNARAIVRTFGRRVREERLAAGLSQPELGRLSRVGHKFIGQIERAESNPSLVTMVLVADALQCDVASLLPSSVSAEPSAYIRVRKDDLQRATEAVMALTKRRARVRRA